MSAARAVARMVAQDSVRFGRHRHLQPFPPMQQELLIALFFIPMIP
jgi:hypothetical protein